jgi:hypothetical protein
MANLSKTGIESWLDRLPDDVREVMADPIDAAADPAAIAFAAEIAAVEDLAKVLDLVENNLALFEGLGRARRIRFLAWFASRTYPESLDLFRVLVEGYDDEDSGGRGAIEKVSMILAEDMRALAAALGPRAARQIVTGGTLEAVTGAGYEVTTELEMRQGGSV